MKRMIVVTVAILAASSAWAQVGHVSIGGAGSAEVSVAAGEAHIGQTGMKMASVSATITRPADTTAYAALDAVSDSTSAPAALTFASACRINAGSGTVVKARLMTDQSTNTASFRLHLFSASPTPVNDNAAYTLLWASRTSYLGYVDFDPAATEGTGSDAAMSQNTDVRLPFVCGAAATSIYGLLETLSAFTPASGQNVHLEVTVAQN
jgi:hypothetical protein